MSFIKVNITRACDNCGDDTVEADEILCGKCKHPKIAAIVDRAFDLLENPRNLLLLEVLDKQKDNLDNLNDAQLYFLQVTRADFALLDEFLSAILATPDIVTTDADGLDLRALSKVIKRIRSRTRS